MASTSSSSKYHLKELLNEDQEPFVLNNFIHEKRSQTKPRNSSSFCRNVCFVSLQHTPPTKSPLYNFSSQNKTPNTLFVHIPAKTAALLLEAALRIQNQTEENSKPKSSNGFGLFGSVLKRLKRRKKNGVEKDCDIKVSVKDILKWETEEKHGNEVKKRVSDVGCSCNSSATWTEIETTSTSKSVGSQEYEEEEEAESKIISFDDSDKGSPFRFIISPLRRSPEFLSSSTSPNRRKPQVAKNDQGHLKSGEQDQKEEKEHYCSPVSVLDLEIEDDVEVEDEDDSELERSFAFVHKAKQRLLQKLRRFELLAELDPLELERRIAEDEDEDEDDVEFEDDDYDEKEEQFNEDVVLQNNEKHNSVLKESNYCNRRKAPLDMKRVLIDLMNEEGAEAGFSERGLPGNKRCKRLDSLKTLERNVVNMMVETDFKRERNEWQRNSMHIEETVVEVEFAIFGFLVEELSVELCSV